MAPPGYRFDATTETAVECNNGFFSSGWDRAESCTPCGVNPAAIDDAVGWHSEGMLRLPVRDPNNGLPMRWLSVRGNATSCCELDAVDTRHVYCCHMCAYCQRTCAAAVNALVLLLLFYSKCATPYWQVHACFVSPSVSHGCFLTVVLVLLCP